MIDKEDSEAMERRVKKREKRVWVGVEREIGREQRKKRRERCIVSI